MSQSLEIELQTNPTLATCHIFLTQLFSKDVNIQISVISRCS